MIKDLLAYSQIYHQQEISTRGCTFDCDWYTMTFTYLYMHVVGATDADLWLLMRMTQRLPRWCRWLCSSSSSSSSSWSVAETTWAVAAASLHQRCQSTPRCKHCLRHSQHLACQTIYTGCHEYVQRCSSQTQP